MGRAAGGQKTTTGASAPRSQTPAPPAPARVTPYQGATRYRSRAQYRAARSGAMARHAQDGERPELEFGSAWADQDGAAGKLYWLSTGEMVFERTVDDGGDLVEVLGYVGAKREAELLMAGHEQHAPDLQWARTRIEAFVRANEPRWEHAAPAASFAPMGARAAAPAEPAGTRDVPKAPAQAPAPRGFDAVLGNRRGN